MIKVAIWVLRAANWLNWIMGALFALLLAMMVIDPDQFRTTFERAFEGPRSADALFLWLKLACVCVFAVVGAAHLIFTRLIAMLRDTQAGAAFTETNAKRLAIIARALLTINLVDLAFGQVSIWASEASGEYLGWSLSLTGWFAVPLLLILARIFKEGAIMRDDLEGTV